MQRNMTTSLSVTILHQDTGKILDITAGVEVVHIYMNMGKPTSGDVVVKEDALENMDTNSISAIHQGPINGREIINITFSSVPNSDDKYVGTFVVFAITNVVFSKDVVRYRIHFTDIVAIANPTIRISKKFVGTTGNSISEIFKMLQEHVPPSLQGTMLPKDIDSSCAGNIYKFLVPYWSPLKAISWFTSFAQSGQADNGATLCADCVFFETSSGEWKVKSYHDIFSGYKWQPTWMVQSTNETTPYEEQYNAIEKIDINQILNSQEFVINGMAGQRLYYEDYRNQKATSVPMKFEELVEMVKKSFSGNLSIPHSFGWSYNSVFKHLPTNVGTFVADDELNKVLVPKYLYGEALHSWFHMFQITVYLNFCESISVGDCLDLSNLSMGDKLNSSSIPLGLVKTLWGIDAVAHTVTHTTMETTVHGFSPTLAASNDSYALYPNEQADMHHANNSIMFNTPYQQP